MVNKYLNFKILLCIMCEKTRCFITYVFIICHITSYVSFCRTLNNKRRSLISSLDHRSFFRVITRHKPPLIYHWINLYKKKKIVWLLVVLGPIRDKITLMETSPTGDGCKFLHILGTYGHRAARVLRRATPTVTRGIRL